MNIKMTCTTRKQYRAYGNGTNMLISVQKVVPVLALIVRHIAV